jgi:UDP-glucose 4-epimerase
MKHNLILVGGMGFIGRNILDALTDEVAYDVFQPFVIDDLSNASPRYETLQVPRYIGPYQASDAVAALPVDESGGRTFVFLAGETRVAESKDRPLDFIDANIAHPAAFVWAAVRPGDHFILISTAGALFDGTTEVTVKSAYCPKNFYGASKAAEEMVLEQIVNLKGAYFSIVRLTNVFGVYSEKKKSAIHAFTKAVIKDNSVTINGDGYQSRDFIFSRDVGRGIVIHALRALKKEGITKVSMLGAGVSTTLWDVIHAIEEVAGKKLKYTLSPAEELVRTEPRDVIANPQDVRVLLEDSITPFLHGIRATYDYYLQSER